MSLKALKKEAFKNEAVRIEYDRLAGEFDLVDQLITMRTEAGLTQDELARRLNTAKGNISRLERGRGNPSWSTLNRYAKACGYQVRLEAVPDDKATA